jgi:hypothetical protein
MIGPSVGRSLADVGPDPGGVGALGGEQRPAGGQFAQEYAAMLNGVLGRGLPTAVCTIYEPRFPDLRQRRLAATGLTVFNDCITREAFAHGLSLIDLRLICDRDEDFANPIEPSVRGGAKIAAAIAALVTNHGSARRSEIFARVEDKPQPAPR